MQVEHVPFDPNVRDVRHPHLVDTPHLKAFYKIGILPVGVGRVGRPPPLGAGQCQAFRCEEPKEGVAPARHLPPQFGLQDDMELYAPKARPSPSVVLHAGHKQLAALTLRDDSAMTRIVPLAVLAKQSAEEPDIQPGELLPQRLYCLAPPFFNIEMPSSCSAICIIFSKARLRSFSSSSARSRSEMRFRRISSLLSFVP